MISYIIQVIQLLDKIYIQHVSIYLFFIERRIICTTGATCKLTNKQINKYIKCVGRKYPRS